MKIILKFLDKTFWIYVVLGILNYAVCNAIMLVLRFSFSVERDSALYIEFALQTMVSFLVNRFVTFRSLKISRWWWIMFFVSVGVSYLIAKVLLLELLEYLITLPFFISISDWVQNIVAKAKEPMAFREALVMLACTFVYCVINYIGQRYYVFRPMKEGSVDHV